MNLYIKALHIIFVVTWFAGLFYMPRLFIYNTEANDKPEAVISEDVARNLGLKIGNYICYPDSQDTK